MALLQYKSSLSQGPIFQVERLVWYLDVLYYINITQFGVYAERTTCEALWLAPYTDDLVQERRNSTANALELHLSCINPLILQVSDTTVIQAWGPGLVNDLVLWMDMAWPTLWQYINEQAMTQSADKWKYS